MLEVEIKIKVDIEKTKSKLNELGFVKTSSVYEQDVYYNSEYNDLKKSDKALRIREHRDLDTGETVFELNFKGPKIDDSTMTREETEFPIPSLLEGEKMLNGLGYFAAGRVEKERTHYVKGNITCCLDTVTNLGEFLEIEIIAGEEEYDLAICKINDLLNKLGLRMEDTIRHSYLSMLMELNPHA